MASEFVINTHPSAVEHAKAVAWYAAKLAGPVHVEPDACSPGPNRVVSLVLTVSERAITEYPGLLQGLASAALQGDCVNSPGWSVG